MREHASRRKCVLTGLWELIPGFETFNVILRNTTVSFKYFKQCSMQAVFQVPVSHHFGQARSTSSKYCWALELLGAHWIYLGAFFFHKYMAWLYALCLYQLSCSSIYLTVTRKNGCLGHKSALPASKWSKKATENTWLVKIKISTILSSARDAHFFCVSLTMYKTELHKADCPSPGQSQAQMSIPEPAPVGAFWS